VKAHTDIENPHHCFKLPACRNPPELPDCQIGRQIARLDPFPTTSP
jgi:hypothetical protein